MKVKFEVNNQGGSYFWSLLDDQAGYDVGGGVIAEGQTGFTTKDACLHQIRLLKLAMNAARIVDLTKGK